jgi:hypothetical protein
MTNSVIKELLQGHHSNAIASFFCGEYFVQTVTNHPKFEELKAIFWSIETSLYNRQSKKTKARRTLQLTSRVSGFFGNPNLVNDKKMIALQREILGDWAKYDDYFGVSINWYEVFKSAFNINAITKTQSDYDSLVSLMDIPNY